VSQELKFALDYENHLSVLPLRVDDTYPPEPPGVDELTYQNLQVAEGRWLGIVATFSSNKMGIYYGYLLLFIVIYQKMCHICSMVSFVRSHQT
jgi:hypothetical protein